MEKEIYKLSSQYIKDLKKRLRAGDKKITPYVIANASFRKNNADLIIKRYDKKNLTIKYLDGTVQKFLTYNEFINMVKNLTNLYPTNRKHYMQRYFKVIKAYVQHKKAMRKKIQTIKKETKNTLADTLSTEQLKVLKK